MSKLSQHEEKELVSFIKDWLKSHGYNQKDLAYELNIKSSRTTEIILKIKELYKKGGIFNIAKNLIKIEQNWLNGIKNDYLETKQSGQSHVATDQERGVRVRNVVLDLYCQTNGIDEIDFAKIDLEGHELFALRGWENCLSRHDIRAIYIEIMPENQWRYGLKTNSPLIFLESLGYELFLCKEEDFLNFGMKPKKYTFNSKTLILSKFKALDFPENFATDILALVPIN